MLDAQHAVEPGRHAGLLEHLADRRGGERLAGFHAPAGDRPGRAVLALLGEQEAMAAAHDDECEVPGRDRATRRSNTSALTRIVDHAAQIPCAAAPASCDVVTATSW